MAAVSPGWHDLFSLRVRLVVIFAVASLPLLTASSILIAARPPGPSAPDAATSAGLLALAYAVGLAVVSAASYAFVVKPLRALNASVRRWKAGSPFTSDQEAERIPFEVSQLAASFQSATLTLEQREIDLRVAIEQQGLLMQEIHHRVKNNLQIVASLMNLQASRIRQPEAKAEFQSARDRIRALATLHRHLYAHGELHTINMRGFLVELCGQLFQAMGEKPGDRIKLEIDAPELQMTSDQAVPLSLIVTEAVSNAIKYAFAGREEGRLRLSLARTPDGARIGLIRLPEICANICFGGTRRNQLFMCASQSLYVLPVETRGAHYC